MAYPLQRAIHYFKEELDLGHPDKAIIGSIIYLIAPLENHPDSMSWSTVIFTPYIPTNQVLGIFDLNLLLKVNVDRLYNIFWYENSNTNIDESM